MMKEILRLLSLLLPLVVFTQGMGWAQVTLTNGDFEAGPIGWDGVQATPGAANQGYIRNDLRFDHTKGTKTHTATAWHQASPSMFPWSLGQTLAGSMRAEKWTIFSGWVLYDYWTANPVLPAYEMRMLVDGKQVATTGIIHVDAGRDMVYANHRLAYQAQTLDVGKPVRIEFIFNDNGTSGFSFDVDDVTVRESETDDTQSHYTIEQLRLMAGKRFWKKYSGNPILSPGSPGVWDDWGIGSMSVVRAGDLYHLFYEGWGLGTIQIGHATSTDGIHWEKDPANPVLPIGATGWDSGGTWDPFVIYEGGKFKMWYGGDSFQWGYAESDDGSHFTKKGQISFFPHGEIEDDHVVHDAQTGKYYMYYWDRNYEPMGLYVATSPDETNFDFDHALPITIQGLVYPAMYKFTHVIQEQGKWYMFFAQFVRFGCDGSKTGYATSTDGIHWTMQNQSLLVGQDGEIIKAADDLYLMYYTPDGLFDTQTIDIRVALYDGDLDSLVAKSTPYAHWKMDETQGVRALDSTGAGCDGTLTNVNAVNAWTQGVFEGALSLDGVDDFVNIDRPDEFDFERDFTWAAWIKTNQSGTVIARAPALGNWVPAAKALFIRNGKLVFDVGSVGSVESHAMVNDGRWHHVAVTVKFGATSVDFNDAVQLYVDGRPDGLWNNQDLTRTKEAGFALKLGHASDNFGGPFKGLMDDVRIYDQVLPAEAIRRLATTRARARAWPLYNVFCRGQSSN